MAQTRYSSVAIALHWAIALLILAQIAGGFYMHNLPNEAGSKFDLYQLHKSFGLSILLLTLVRLAWRLTHPVPALPAAMPDLQKLVARGVHIAFYGLLIATPLVGLAMVSVSPKDIDTKLFGIIGVPHLGFITGGELSREAELRLMGIHEVLAFTILGLFILHVGAAVKHHFIDRDGVFASMARWNAKALSMIGAIFAALFLGVGVYFLVPSGGATASGPDPAATTASAAPSAVPSACSGDDRLAVNWDVEQDQSRLAFIGEQNGRPFEGTFAEFEARIAFDEERLAASWIEVDVRTKTAASGDELRDSTMEGGEWFDVDDHPRANFTACSISKTDDGFVAEGALTIKDNEVPLSLPFTLTRDGDQATAKGKVDLIRTRFDLGNEDSWLESEGVALEVAVEFEISATKTQD